MFKNILVLLSLFSYTFVTAVTTQKPLCKEGTCSSRNAQGCSCYCSVKCGPREIKPEDTPKYDEETGQCFCAPRDKALYKRNTCDIKEEAKLHETSKLPERPRLQEEVRFQR